MSDFLIFKAAFNNSATPAVGTYTAEGATAQFNKNTSISPDYYLYNTAQNSAVQWFVPTAETTDFEFVADILTRGWSNNVTYFIIADSTGTTRLRMWSVYTNWHFENSDGTGTSGNPEYIGTINPTTSGGFGVFHQFRVRVRKLTESSSSVEVYVDGTLKLTATAGAALITCAKIGFVGGVSTFGPGIDVGVKNAYVYDLSGGEVIDRGVLSGAFNRFINWMKSVFALKSDIPTVNDATLTIQQNGTTVDTFTANSSSDKTVNITVPTATSQLSNDSGYITEDATKIPLSGTNAITGTGFFKSTSDSQLQIGSGTSTATGGCLIMYGSEYSNADLAGSFRLRARKTSNYDLLGKGDGTLTWGTKNVAMQEDVIPRSGGAVITGYALSRDVDTEGLFIRGGSVYDTGAQINLYGANHSSQKGVIQLLPNDTSSKKYLTLTPDGTFTWEGTAIQYISDQRYKQQIDQIDDKLLDAWEDVELSQFKYNDAVETKGDKARLHTGYVVQQIQKACENHGVDISAYGLFCHEEYPEETEEVEVEQKDGTKTKERKVIREVNEHYSLRYTEALIVECKYLRRCIERLEARLAQLENPEESQEKGVDK